MKAPEIRNTQKRETRTTDDLLGALAQVIFIQTQQKGFAFGSVSIVLLLATI